MRWNANIPGEWEKCFAWIPVHIGAYWVWFESFEYKEIGHDRSWRLIERKREEVYIPFPPPRR